MSSNTKELNGPAKLKTEIDIKKPAVQGIVKCGGCKFWDKKQQIFFDKIYGVCTAINEADQSRESEVVAYVGDCMDGCSPHKFHTRADFGCVKGKRI
jgi:hypothetical protein